MNFKELLVISRPRFWLYTAGPFVVGVAAAGFFNGSFFWESPLLTVTMFLVYLVFFLFPANLLIYGVNDIADGDTDALNQKKQGYETTIEQSSAGTLKNYIRKWNLGGHLLIVLLWFGIGTQVSLATGMAEISVWFFGGLARVLFYLTSIYYSLPPIRAKARPFLDGFFNVLYILPGIIGYLFFGGTITNISLAGILGGWLWCIAMHCYSAIPDIEPDHAAGISTTAVYLGKTAALLYCGVLWIAAAAITYPSLGRISVVGGTIYLVMVGLSFTKNIFSLYKLFPWINAAIGMLLFFSLLL